MKVLIFFRQCSGDLKNLDIAAHNLQNTEVDLRMGRTKRRRTVSQALREINKHYNSCYIKKNNMINW